MTSTNGAPIGKAERVLAYMAMGIAALSLLALIALLASPLFGPIDPTNQIWPMLLLITYIGFPIAFLLIVALILWRIVSNRRSRGGPAN